MNTEQSVCVDAQAKLGLDVPTNHFEGFAGCLIIFSKSKEICKEVLYVITAKNFSCWYCKFHDSVFSEKGNLTNSILISTYFYYCFQYRYLIPSFHMHSTGDFPLRHTSANNKRKSHISQYNF